MNCCFCTLLLLPFLGRTFSEMGRCEREAVVVNASTSGQSLVTPVFPNGHYGPNMDCHWLLMASHPRARIQLTVFTFRIEDRIFTDCDDYLEVVDGDSLTSRTIGKWCGATFPYSITSAGRSLYIHFKTDSVYEMPGVNMSFVEFSCGPGWTKAGGYCYKLWRKDVTWLQAQRFCYFDGSNLLTFDDDSEYASVVELQLLKRGEQPWIGYSDALSETRFTSVIQTDPVWPLKFPNFGKDHLKKDCVYLNSSTTKGIGYSIDFCTNRHTFVCRKRQDGRTLAFDGWLRFGEEEEEEVGVGDARWWLVAIVLLLLTALLVAPCCHRCLCSERAPKIGPQRQMTSAQLLVQNDDRYYVRKVDTGQTRAPPFGRPCIRLLDNVSAISLEQFWHQSPLPTAVGESETNGIHAQTAKTML